MTNEIGWFNLFNLVSLYQFPATKNNKWFSRLVSRDYLNKINYNFTFDEWTLILLWRVWVSNLEHFLLATNG